MPGSKLPEKISAYLCIYNDWDILPHTLRCIAPFVDELVVVDGAYRWMVPFIEGIGKNRVKSAAPVYDCLEAARIPYRVLNGIWETEQEKRKAGYLACRNRYRFRVDADEIYFFNAHHCEEFFRSAAAVGGMETPVHVAPGWVVGDSSANWQRAPFLFDARQIGAEDHLRYLWLVHEARPPSADHPPVFDRPLAFTANLTIWRTPSTSVYRAAFYSLNYIRHHGAPWYDDLAARRLDGLDIFFERVPPRIYLDGLKNHEIVVGNPYSGAPPTSILKPSPLADQEERQFAPLFDVFLRSQAQSNEELVAVGRHTLGPVHIDVTSAAAIRALSTDGTVFLTTPIRLTAATAVLSYLMPAEPWKETVELPTEIDRNQLKIVLPPTDDTAPSSLRRILTLKTRAANGDPLIRFARA